MRSPVARASSTTPLLLDKARPLAAYLQMLTPAQLQTVMNISDMLAHKVHDTLAAWNAESDKQSLAVDSFIGDIYSGLRAIHCPRGTVTTPNRRCVYCRDSMAYFALMTVSARIV